jgi:hypothetical protein
MGHKLKLTFLSMLQRKLQINQLQQIKENTNGETLGGSKRDRIFFCALTTISTGKYFDDASAQMFMRTTHV